MANIQINGQNVNVTIMAGGDNKAYGNDMFYTSRVYRFVATASMQRDEEAFKEAFKSKIISGVIDSNQKLDDVKVIGWNTGDDSFEMFKVSQEQEAAKFN